MKRPMFAGLFLSGISLVLASEAAAQYTASDPLRGATIIGPSVQVHRVTGERSYSNGLVRFTMAQLVNGREQYVEVEFGIAYFLNLYTRSMSPETKDLMLRAIRSYRSGRIAYQSLTLRNLAWMGNNGYLGRTRFAAHQGTELDLRTVPPAVPTTSPGRVIEGTLVRLVLHDEGIAAGSDRCWKWGTIELRRTHQTADMYTPDEFHLLRRNATVLGGTWTFSPVADIGSKIQTILDNAVAPGDRTLVLAYVDDNVPGISFQAPNGSYVTVPGPLRLITAVTTITPQ